MSFRYLSGWLAVSIALLALVATLVTALQQIKEPITRRLTLFLSAFVLHHLLCWHGWLLVYRNRRRFGYGLIGVGTCLCVCAGLLLVLTDFRWTWDWWL